RDEGAGRKRDMLGLGKDYDIIPLVIPIDLDSSQGGDQFSLRDADGVDLVFITGDGDTGRDLTFTVKKHVDMSDGTGTTIDLSAIAHPRDCCERGASSVGGQGTWSKGDIVDVDGAAVVLDDAEGESSSLIVFHISASDLGSGYSALSVSAVVAGGSGA